MSEWYDEAVGSEEDLVDRVASLANGMKFSWSAKDKAEMRNTARIIIDNVRRPFSKPK